MQGAAMGGLGHADANAGDGPMPLWERGGRGRTEVWDGVKDTPSLGWRGLSGAGAVAVLEFGGQLQAFFFQGAGQTHPNTVPIAIVSHDWKPVDAACGSIVVNSGDFWRVVPKKSSERTRVG